MSHKPVTLQHSGLWTMVGGLREEPLPEVEYTASKHGDLLVVEFAVRHSTELKLAFFVESRKINPAMTAAFVAQGVLDVNRLVSVNGYSCPVNKNKPHVEISGVKALVVDGIVKTKLTDDFSAIVKNDFGIYVEPFYQHNLLAENVSACGNKVTYTMVFQRTKTRKG